jgi:sugar lactone lactonase YvrE
MYYIDTLEKRVDFPDGMTLDAEGGLWVALWGGGRVLHLLPDGTVAGAIEVPVSQTSSCCFGGPDLRDLYITTAWQGLPEERRETHAGSLFRCRPGVAGRPPSAYRTRA